MEDMDQDVNEEEAGCGPAFLISCTISCLMWYGIYS
jgi:hypothetical protein